MTTAANTIQALIKFSTFIRLYFANENTKTNDYLLDITAHILGE